MKRSRDEKNAAKAKIAEQKQLPRAKSAEITVPEVVEALIEANGSKMKAAFILTERKKKYVDRQLIYWKINTLKQKSQEDPQYKKMLTALEVIEDLTKDMIITSWHDQISSGDWLATQYALRTKCGIHDNLFTGNVAEIPDSRKRMILGDLDDELPLDASDTTTIGTPVDTSRVFED